MSLFSACPVPVGGTKPEYKSVRTGSPSHVRAEDVRRLFTYTLTCGLVRELVILPVVVPIVLAVALERTEMALDLEAVFSSEIARRLTSSEIARSRPKRTARS